MKNYGNPFKIQVPEELKRKLDLFAKETGQSRSDVVREAITAFIRKQSALTLDEDAATQVSNCS